MTTDDACKDFTMPPTNTYLFFDGTAREAFTFYADVLGGTIQAMLDHRGTPAAQDVAPEMLDRIIHCQINLPGGGVIMASDVPPEYKTPMKGFSIAVHFTDPDRAEQVFKRLTEGGEVTVPMQPTFFARRWGMGVDRFGVPWMVNCPPSA